MHVNLSLSAMVWMPVYPPNSYAEILMPNVMTVLEGRAFGRCLCHESVALMNGVSALQKEPPEIPSSFHQVMLQWEVVNLWSRKGLSPECDCTGVLILDFPASETVGNIRLLFKLSSLWYFVKTSQKD